MYKVYASGFVGNLGTEILIEKKYDELVKHFGVEFIDKALNDIKGGDNPSLNMSNDIIDKIEIGKGGVLTALWQLCEKHNLGLEYNMRKIPIMQATVEISNYYNINPYRLLTKNAYLFLIDTNDDKDFDKLDMAEIGKITNDNKRVRIDGETRAFLTKDFKDEIDKIIRNPFII